jgi:hypothetical protein
MSNTVIQAFDEERFQNAVVSGTAPFTSYDLATVITRQPGARVLFPSNSVSIVFTLPVARQCDVLCIPVTNATSGTLNGHALSFPATSRSGVPRTLANDLTLNGASANTASWTLALSGPNPIVIGGGVSLYGPVHRLNRDLLATGLVRAKTSGQLAQKNEYLTPYFQAFRTMEQVITLMHYEPTAVDVSDFEDWFDGSNGAGFPSLLWLNIPSNEGHYGVWDPTLEIKRVESGLFSITMKFNVWAKGKPL